MGSSDLIAGYSEAKDVVNVSIKQKSSRYLDEFVQLRCAPDLLAYNLFPNAKEITESVAAFNAYRKYFRHIPTNDPDVAACVVGDGSTPRTAALFAMRTAWQVWSVDPNMKEKTSWKRIQRLYLKKAKIEDFSHLKFDLLILVHAHVDLESLQGMTQNIICIPCCFRQDSFCHYGPDFEYDDFGIWSPKRTVKIWRDFE
jgi:hypothetical protein